jgi:hypothetical protein
MFQKMDGGIRGGAKRRPGIGTFFDNLYKALPARIDPIHASPYCAA